VIPTPFRLPNCSDCATFRERLESNRSRRTPVDDDTIGEHRNSSQAAAVAEIENNRAVIGQAKGMLILVYGVDEDAAFEMLGWRSQSTNTKLRTLAEQLVADYRSLCNGEALPSRAVYDKALMSVHKRISGTKSRTHRPARE
jgi:ANTAR domain